MDLSIVVLAAGKGTRMNVDCPKVLLPIIKKPMICYLLDTIKLLKSRTILILGHQKDRITQTLTDYHFEIAIQDKQLGTGHALLQSMPLFEDKPCKEVLVLSGDVPFIQASTLQNLIQLHRSKKASITLLSANLKNPHHYGRIIKNQKGHVQAIREFKDCSVEELKINEINAGMYLFDYDLLRKNLPTLTTENAQQEFYLTDLIAIAVNQKLPVFTYLIDNEIEILGANTSKDLAILEQHAKHLQ